MAHSKKISEIISRVHFPSSNAKCPYYSFLHLLLILDRCQEMTWHLLALRCRWLIIIVSYSYPYETFNSSLLAISYIASEALVTLLVAQGRAQQISGECGRGWYSCPIFFFLFQFHFEWLYAQLKDYISQVPMQCNRCGDITESDVIATGKSKGKNFKSCWLSL